MHDVILAHILSDTVYRDIRESSMEDKDPDELYKYEMWNSYRRPSRVMQFLRTVYSRLLHSNYCAELASAARSRGIESSGCTPEHRQA